MRVTIYKGIQFKVRAIGAGLIAGTEYKAVLFKTRGVTATNYQFATATAAVASGSTNVQALFTFGTAQTSLFDNDIDVTLEVYDNPVDPTQRKQLVCREPFAHVKATSISY